MTLIPLTSGAYQSESVIANAQRCVNLYPETNPANTNPPVPVTHYQRPGKVRIGTLVAPPTPTPPLPAGPSFAWSTRRLLDDYDGPAMRVVRVSDSVQMDIGFAAPGRNADLDVAALLAFVGAGDGRIQKWYDQSGNGEDLTANLGPSLYIVKDGALAATIGGKPALLSVPADTARLTANNVTFGAAEGTISTVANVATGGSSDNGFPGGGNPGIWDINGGNPVDGFVLAFPQSVVDGAPCALFARTFTFAGSQFPQPTTVSYAFGTDQLFMYRFLTDDTPPNNAYSGNQTPGTSSGNVAYNNSPPYGMGMGGIFDGSGFPAFSGLVSEIIGYDTQLSVDDTNMLGENQAAYWGVPWADIS